MQVKELMKSPYVLDKDISLSEAAKIMAEKKIGSLLFVPKKKVEGLITEGDLIKYFGQEKKVSEIMIKNIFFSNPDDTIQEALKSMKSNKISILPVIDSKKKLVGLLSLNDIAFHMDKLDGEFLIN